MENNMNIKQPKMVEVKYGDHSDYWHPDPAVRAMLIDAMRAVAAQSDMNVTKIVDPVNEMDRLADLDAQVQGDHHAQALSWILNARP
jgi:hypothetical protein